LKIPPTRGLSCCKLEGGSIQVAGKLGAGYIAVRVGSACGLPGNRGVVVFVHFVDTGSRVCARVCKGGTIV
jgi:hypothetical protein